ncbi:MAG: acyl-CoA dehydrogenase [Actinophytocola sp.]|nr:acyl-CoA dehydrogenase [Actinophytocola sp.]
MRFALSAQHIEFARSINGLLREAGTPAVIRAWAAGEHASGLALWRRLAEVGVTALAVPEQHGGLGADPVDLAVAFETMGYHAMPGPIVESIAVLPALLAPDDALAGRWLPGIADGSSIATVAMAPHVPYALDADVADIRLQVTDSGLAEFTPAAVPLDSVDAARRLYEVMGRRAISRRETAADAAFDHGVLACAAQLLGLGQRLLDDSVEYAKQRNQYGNPIGSYQAIKHLLADVATQLELARPLLHGAAVALAGDAATTSRDVSAAKVACGDAGYLAARTALQVHGAIGYTAEHDLGRWLTKARALRSAWGTPAFHRARVLDALMAERAS